MVIRVALAEVRWGYQVAGVFRECTLIRSDGAWTATGRVVQTDAFRVSQRPLAFEVKQGHRVRRWPIDTLQIADGQFSAALGPQES